MLKSKAWFEEFAYVECPCCSTLLELGVDFEFIDDMQIQCDECSEPFMIERPAQ